MKFSVALAGALVSAFWMQAAQANSVQYEISGTIDGDARYPTFVADHAAPLDIRFQLSTADVQASDPTFLRIAPTNFSCNVGGKAMPVALISNDPVIQLYNGEPQLNFTLENKGGDRFAFNFNLTPTVQNPLFDGSSETPRLKAGKFDNLYDVSTEIDPIGSLEATYLSLNGAQVSVTPVPEPSTAGLVGFAGTLTLAVGLARTCLRRKAQSA